VIPIGLSARLGMVKAVLLEPKFDRGIIRNWQTPQIYVCYSAVRNGNYEHSGSSRPIRSSKMEEKNEMGTFPQTAFAC